MLSTQEIMEYVRDRDTVSEKKQFSAGEARDIGEKLGVSWELFDVEQFRIGLNIELEHGRRDPATDITHDDPTMTGKIVLAHLNEIPDYYTHLAHLEQEFERPSGGHKP